MPGVSGKVSLFGFLAFFYETAIIQNFHFVNLSDVSNKLEFSIWLY